VEGIQIQRLTPVLSHSGRIGAPGSDDGAARAGGVDGPDPGGVPGAGSPAERRPGAPPSVDVGLGAPEVTQVVTPVATPAVTTIRSDAGRRRVEGGTMTATDRTPAVGGWVERGFEPVRDAFVENFTHRGEIGAACCAYRHGRKVVDLWGGVRDRASGEPWGPDTMVVVHSATKGMAAMVTALFHARGLIDYDERVAAYWPEFAQAGKEAITVRRLLAHQAGLFAFDEKVDASVVADLDRLAGAMERQRPAWPPGERQAYHAITLGFYEGEIVRRVDPSHRTLGRVFADEIARPLEIDFHIGLPDDIPAVRVAPLVAPPVWKRFLGMPLPIVLAGLNRRSVLYRSLIANPGTGFYVDRDGMPRRNLEVPSGGGVGSARALARAYGVLAAGGGELGIAAGTVEALKAPAVPSVNGFFDECLRGPAKFSLGFMKPSDSFPFGSGDEAFGAPGAGGSMGHADPATGIGYGYVTNRMGTELSGDGRDVALRRAIDGAVSAGRT